MQPPTGVVGMVHLPALPGAPGFDGDRTAIRERAVRDAETLEAGGVDAVIVENFGDAPFFADEVPSHVVADMTAATRAVRGAIDIPVGVNILRNEAKAAVAVAAAAGASFVRVNVYVGARVTDQGVVEGCAAETTRLRHRIDADVAVLADVGVKHSTALGTEDPVAEARDAIDRGRADGIIVSGPRTGSTASDGTVAAVADACGSDVPLYVGSGVTPETVNETLAMADGVIVGTAVKEDGETTRPVNRERVERLVAAAQ